MSAASLPSNVREYKTVRLWRTSTGFGFSLTGQYPCVLTHVVDGSPAFKAGLKIGDYLIMVNGLNVVKYTHDAVVAMVAACTEYVILQVAQRTAVVSNHAAGVQCTCSLNCQSMSAPHYNVPGPVNAGISYHPQMISHAPAAPPQSAIRLDYCGVVYVGFLKLPLPANPTPAVFTRLLSSSLNHFLKHKNSILMQPLIMSANRQAIVLTDNKNVGYNFILNSVAFIGVIPESPSNMFGLVLHCPPNPICVCHLFSTSLTRQQEHYLRLKTPSSQNTAPDMVRYINYLITSALKNPPLGDSSNFASGACAPPQSNNRRFRNNQPTFQQPNFEAEIFIDNFQFPVGTVYTVSERNAMAAGLSANSVEEPAQPIRRAISGGKPPRCGCSVARIPGNASSTSSIHYCQDHNPENNHAPAPSFDMRQAAMALARSRSLSRYHRKGVRGGSSRSSGSDDGRFGRGGGGSSNGSGSFRVRYGSQRHKNHRSEKHRRRQDSLSGASGSARYGIGDETTTTTSTTTFDSSAANSSRRYQGQLCQSGSSSLYRSRSIDSLINASKDDPQPQPPVGNSKYGLPKANNGVAFFSVQQRVVIDGSYAKIEGHRNHQRAADFYNPQHPTVETDQGGGLALNSLLSPRYTSVGANASETDLDYEETCQPENVAASSCNAAPTVPKNANNTSNNQNVLGQQNMPHLQSHPQKIKQNRMPYTASPFDPAEARESSASVETGTEVAGSTLSLPMSSSASVVTKISTHAQQLTFESLLMDKAAVDLFRKFLKSQVSDENLEFLLACDNFRAATSNEQLANEAAAIYRHFVSQNSLQPVNLTWQIESSIRRALIAADVRGVSPTEPKADAAPSEVIRTGEVSRDMYDAARDHVYRLLKKDCFPRFLQSDYYKELTRENKSMMGSVEISAASTPSNIETNSAFKPSALRLSSRKKSSKTSGASSTTSAPSGSQGGNWNPAKLLSHIIGRAKSKPSRQKVENPQSSFRVTFPDGSVETLSSDELKGGFVASLSDCLGPPCAARGMNVFLCAIYQHGSELPIDGQLSAAAFSGRDLIIEQQMAFVVFYFNGSSMACRRMLVRVKPCRRLVDVLQWDESSVIKEVWCVETPPVSPKTTSDLSTLQYQFNLTKLNISSNFEGVVRDVQNRFIIAIAAGKSENLDSSPICAAVKTHFDSTGVPQFEDVLNALTSSHTWHTFDDYGRINLSKAISAHWQKLHQALAVGESFDSNQSKDESCDDFLENPDLVDALSLERVGNAVASVPEVALKEPRSRRPIIAGQLHDTSTTSSTGSHKPTSAFHVRLVRGAHPLGEIMSEQYGRATPSSLAENSFSSDRIVGVNNQNYEIIDAQGNIRQSAGRVSKFVRVGSSNEIYQGSPIRESNSFQRSNHVMQILQNSIGEIDENSCLLNDEPLIGHSKTNASPYARRLPRPIQLPKIAINVSDEMSGSGLRSSTPSPSTHQLVYRPTHSESNGSPTKSEMMSSANTVASTVRITESTL